MSHDSSRQTARPVDLFCRRYGAGPVVVICHGFLGCSDNWHTLARRLSESCRVLVPDMRNHGRSPHAEAFSYPALAADVCALLARHDVTRAAIVGHSMGGKVAMQVALTQPHLVGRLAVVDIAPRAYHAAPEALAVLDAMLELDVTQFRKRSEVDAELARSISDLGTRRLVLKNLGRDGNGVFRWRSNVRVLRDKYDAVLQAVRLAGPRGVPTLLLSGARSTYVGPDDAAHMRRLFPELRHHVVEDAGHWLHAEAPEETARVLIDFLGLNV